MIKFIGEFEFTMEEIFKGKRKWELIGPKQKNFG